MRPEVVQRGLPASAAEGTNALLHKAGPSLAIVLSEQLPGVAAEGVKVVPVPDEHTTARLSDTARDTMPRRAQRLPLLLASVKAMVRLIMRGASSW